MIIHYNISKIQKISNIQKICKISKNNKANNKEISAKKIQTNKLIV